MQGLILRGAAAGSLVVLAVLSWLPGQDMVRTGLFSPSEEHFFAYMISGALVAAAMPRYRFLHVACFYALLAAVLELGQNIAPGRDAEALTALVSMCGAVAGEIVARLATGAWRDRFGFPPSLAAASRGQGRATNGQAFDAVSGSPVPPLPSGPGPHG